MNTPAKKLLILQSVLLLMGSMYAWSKLAPQFSTFLAKYGTIFHFVGCTVPNPLTTACLYGSLAFLAALYWSFVVYQTPTPKSERYLRNFLLFCVVFAVSVNAYEALQFYKIISETVSVSCTPGVSPWGTPCFFGALFFIGAFITSVFATRRLASLPETVEAPDVRP